jgi:glycosyltransferase involved in cell wall biosynthesis
MSGAESSRQVGDGGSTARSTWLLVLPWDLSAPGGVSQVVQSLYDITQRRFGHRSMLLVNTWGQREPVIDEVDGRRTVRMMVQGPTGTRNPVRNLISFLVRLPGALLRLRRLLRDERVARVNVHYPALDAMVWLLVRPLVRPRPEVVLSFHGSDLQEVRVSRGPTRLLWRALLRGADDITVCSTPLRDELLRDFGTDAARARDVLNGVDPAHVGALGSGAPRTATPARFILSLATIEHKKGLDTLIASFGRLAERFPDVSLVLAGRVAEPAYFHGIQAQRDALPCAQRVLFLPDLPHAEAMRVLARAEVLALASRKEPFGIVVLEAGVLGVPVVATSVCGVVDCLGDEPNLVVVPPDDPAALAQGLATVLDDPAQARRLAEAHAAQVLADFTWERVASQYTAPPPVRDGNAATR